MFLGSHVSAGLVLNLIDLGSRSVLQKHILKTNSKLALIFSIFCFSKVVFASEKSAHFFPLFVGSQNVGLTYARLASRTIFGLSGQISKAKCAVICLHADSCQGFYMDNGACVFGVSADDVTAFHEGQNINPEPDQII